MRLESFCARVEAGKAVAYAYGDAERQGLVNIWKHDGRIVLTWEECPPGAQYDESAYTRDERAEFADLDSVVSFLRSSGLDPVDFSPA